MSKQYKLIPGVQTPIKSRTPRKLTKKELNYLVKMIPLPLAGGSENQQLIYKQRKELIYQQLAKEEICEEALPEIMQEIINAYSDSEIVPGTPVGNIIATMIGRLLSQATLSSFHKAGLENTADSAIKLTLSLLYVQKEPQNQNCTIYFNNPLYTQLDILSLAKNIEEATLDNFIKDYIYKQTDIEPEWWQKNILLQYPDLWQEHACYARVILDKDMLYKYQLMPQDLIIYFMELGNDSDVILASPIEDAFLDIFVTPDTQKELFKNYVNIPSKKALLEQLYLENVILSTKELKNKHIAGIKKLKNLRTIRVNLSSLVDEISIEDDNNVIFPALVYNKEKSNRYTVNISNLVRWLETANLPYTVPEDDDIIICNISYEQLKELNNNEETTLLDELNRRKDKENIEYNLNNLGPISLHSEYVYAICKGNNLLDLYSLPYVDSTRTSCDDIRVMEKILGIETARNFFVNRMPDILSSAGLNVEPALINTLASIQCNRGQFYGTNYTGVTLQGGINILDIGTIQRTVETAINGIFNNVQPLATSTSIMTGVPVKVGTGSVIIAYEGEKNGKSFLTIGEEIHKRFKEDDKERLLRRSQGLEKDVEQGFDDDAYLPTEDLTDNMLDNNDINMAELSSDNIPNMIGGIEANAVINDNNLKEIQNITNILKKYQI
jgi:hypothetical protein